jgi:hypothetical protein
MLRKDAVYDVLKTYEQDEIDVKHTRRYASQSLERWKGGAHRNKGYNNTSVAAVPYIENDRERQDEQLLPSKHEREVASRRMASWRQHIDHRPIKTYKEVGKYFSQRVSEIRELNGLDQARECCALSFVRQSENPFDGNVHILELIRETSYEEWSQIDSRFRRPYRRLQELEEASTLEDKSFWEREEYMDHRTRHEPSQSAEYGWSDSEEEDMSSLF